MPPQSTNRTTVRVVCALISAACTITAAVIRANHHEPPRAPSWYQSDDPCDYKIGDQYGHLTICDLNSPDPGIPSFEPTPDGTDLNP